MRKVFLLVAVFAMMLPSMISAADKDSGEVIAKEFILEDFDGLKAGNRFDVELEHSSWYSVTVTLPAELEAYLDVKVENGNLVLGLNNTSQKIISLFKDKDWKIKAKVNCPDMERIHLSGAAKLTMLDEFRVSSLDIKVSGASSLDRALFKGDGNISLNASGASHAELELSGNYSSAEIRCSGASNLYVSGGKYDRCYIDASGASDMEMENVGFADVSVELSGASKLLLSGSADFLNVDAGGASSCKAASLVADRARVEASGASSVTVNAKSMDYTDISRSSSFRNRR